MERSPVAKVKPALVFTAIWLIPSMVRSMGSSMVIMFFVILFNFWRVAYSVVDLPLPVGPVSKIMP